METNKYLQDVSGIHGIVKEFSEVVKENSGIHGNVKKFSGRKRKFMEILRNS